MSYDWEVHVEHRHDLLSTFVYVVRRTSDGRIQFLTKGGTEVVERDDGVRKEEAIEFMRVDDDHILSLIVHAFDKRGIKAPSQSYIEGKHEATQAHLNDLRMLIPKLADSAKPVLGEE